MAEQQAEQLIREAERSKVKMHEAKGKDEYNQTLLQSVIIDEGYLQVVAHMDRNLQEKVLRFEYIDFSRLLPLDRLLQQDDQRLTFINKGGTPYLVPASENGKDAQITSYARWEQAFCVFSEIITSKFPQKAQELLPYSYVIHTAAQTYTWENVYAYDCNFCIHVSNNPSCTWSMQLKDKVRDFSTSQSNVNTSGKSKD